MLPCKFGQDRGGLHCDWHCFAFKYLQWVKTANWGRPSLWLTLFRVPVLTVGQDSKLRGGGVAFTVIDTVSRSNTYSRSRQQTEGREPRLLEYTAGVMSCTHQNHRRCGQHSDHGGSRGWHPRIHLATVSIIKITYGIIEYPEWHAGSRAYAFHWCAVTRVKTTPTS